MLLFLLFSATLIPDEIHFPDNESFHRLTMDSMMALTEKYFGERDPIYWEPVDASRYYFTSDSFYLVVLDEHWERIIWQKCREEGRGFYTAGPAKRYGGKDHEPGALLKPKAIDTDGNDIFVADYDNNRVSRLSLDRNNDTITVDCHYTGPYDGMTINHPVDVAIGHDFIYRYVYILDKGNNRFIKLFWPYNTFLYSYDGVNDNISFDNISGLSVRRIPNSSNPPRYYVFLMGEDKLYLLKEQAGNPPVKLINVLHFPGARFTGIDASSSVVLVVDNVRDIILGLAPDLSRSYFAYSSSSALSSDVFNVSVCGDDIVTFAPYLSSTGMDFFKLDLTNIPEDKPRDLSGKGYETHVRLYWHPTFHSYDEYVIERREESEELWKIVGRKGFLSGWSYDDNQVESGKRYFYRVRAYKTDYYTAPTDSISITVPYCNKPTNLQAIFEDSIVRLTWEDNSELNKEYYVGKEVTGMYNNQDTTVAFHLVHLPGDSESFIDTMLIEGRNIYRVAAIDSTGNYWYSDYDTIDIPIQKLSDLRVISKPDTTAYIRFKNNSSLITASSIRKRTINNANYNLIKWFNGNEASGYLDQNIKVESTYVYRCHSEQKIDNIYYFWSWGENPDSIIYHWELDTIPPEVEISYGDYGIGGIEYELNWTASDNGGIYEQEIDFNGDVINIDGEIREYTLSRGNYNGWYNTVLTVEDYSELTSSDNQNVALFDPANKDISIYLWLENPGSGSKVYLHYTVPEANQWYTMYTRLNDGNWIGGNCYFRNYSGDMDVGKIYPGESYSAFVSKESGNIFIHYSNVAYATNSSGGGGQCPLLYVHTDTGFVLDNSLLPRSEYIQKTYKDRYILRVSPNTTEGYRFMVLDNVDTAYIDLIRFYAVDHPESAEVGVTNKGKMIPYSVNALPVTAYDNKNMEWTNSVRYIGRGYYRGEKGKNDTLYVEFGKGDGDYITTTRD
ncbi:hypothetical protein KAX29_02460, partial [candidate division WOR-3 bacterium]|nr:hypothetical protein [candidate division WOR-3 bacterium]